MIHISFKNKRKYMPVLTYDENNLAEIGYDLKKILDQGATNIMVFNK